MFHPESKGLRASASELLEAVLLFLLDGESGGLGSRKGGYAPVKIGEWRGEDSGRLSFLNRLFLEDWW